MLNKKVNTILFILGATVFNIVVTLVSIASLLFLTARFVAPLLSESALSWTFSIIFIISIAISVFVYRAILKHLITKIDIEKYFDPLFVRRYQKPKPPQA